MRKSLPSLRVSSRKSIEKQLVLVFPLPVRHRQEARAKQRAEVHHFTCVPADGCLSLWLLFNLFQPSQEFSVALEMPCPSSLFCQISSVKLNQMVEWKEVKLSLLTIL